ncbi:MAG: heavy-metal-associated domain-containing protein [Bacteroidia bacterium]|nr:heavy-metal-associated domain-containing protein [Bacteroidia bacterium]
MRILLRLLFVSLIASLAGCGAPSTTVFFAEGNCAECQPLIEKALKELKGVHEAAWAFETSLVTVSYDSTRISLDDMEAHLASKGFATGYFEPDTAARRTLPACCQETINRALKSAPSLPSGH